MLILARREQERVTVRVNGELLVTVTVTKVRSNGQVRLGFEAPDHVQIDRFEVDTERQNGGRA